MLAVLGNDSEVELMKSQLSEKVGSKPNTGNKPVNEQSGKQPIETPVDEQTPLDIGNTNPNDPASIQEFQKKVSLFKDLYKSQKKLDFYSRSNAFGEPMWGSFRDKF